MTERLVRRRICGYEGRMSQSTLLLLPVFIQVALTFTLLFRLGPARVAAVQRGDVKLKDIALGQNAWPAPITQISRSYQNQFELPVLFYLLVVLVLVTRKVDLWLVAGAWLFAVSRLLHALIHVTSNNVRNRFYAYLIGTFTLLAMWVWFAAVVVSEGA